jgi:hypothetical protein
VEGGCITGSAEAHCASADLYFCANWGFIAQAKAAELKMENGK